MSPGSPFDLTIIIPPSGHGQDCLFAFIHHVCSVAHILPHLPPYNLLFDLSVGGIFPLQAVVRIVRMFPSTILVPLAVLAVCFGAGIRATLQGADDSALTAQAAAQHAAQISGVQLHNELMQNVRRFCHRVSEIMRWEVHYGVTLHHAQIQTVKCGHYLSEAAVYDGRGARTRAWTWLWT